MRKFTYEVVLDDRSASAPMRVAGLMRVMATALEQDACGGQAALYLNASRGIDFECIKLVKVEDV